MADETPKILYVSDGTIREYDGGPIRHRGKISWHHASVGSRLAMLWARADAPNPSRFTPDDTQAAIDEFLAMFPDAEYGGGHIALSDGNLDVDDLAYCIKACLEEFGTSEDRHGLEAAHFMACLLRLDDAERMWPERGCPCDDCGGCQCRWAGAAENDRCEDRTPCACARDADGFRD